MPKVVLDDSGDVIIVEAKNLIVEVHRTDEGVVADIWVAPIKLGDCSVASTYAFFKEGE